MMQPTPAPSSAPGSPRNRTHEDALNTNTSDDAMNYPIPPQNVGTAPFHVLSGLFDRLSGERKPDKRRKLLDAWFNHWREEKGYDLYPVLRLILPQKDKERAVYGLKEKNIAKTYIKLIPLGPRDPDSIRLLNWKRPSERNASSGDFPTVLYDVVSKRSSVIQGSLTIEELNQLLDELAAHSGKQDIQSKILQRVYNRSTPEEQRWIVRIILKDMNISVKETTVFSVFHPDAQDLYNTCSDLKKVVWELWDPERRLNDEDKEVQLFRAFAPMLCKRPTKKIEDSIKEMGGQDFIIEEKLDGERMQLHKRGNEFYYCSRKGKDYTYLYGKHVGTGSLTPYIDQAFDDRIDDIILDGEMLVWDPVSERNLPFGTLKTAALDRSKKELNPRPCFKVFDLLYLNGQSILRRSTKSRKKNLRNCITPIQGRIEFVDEYKGRTAKDVRDKMEEVMASRGEGLVIKHPGSQYVLNGRNKDWIKVKPEYMDNMGETVDVLVVAGNYGSGKRGGGVSTLICAVYDDRRGASDDEPKYSTFVRIGSGLSFADYVWVRNKPWKIWDPKNPPEWLQTAKKTQEDKGDVYLEPEDSFILKVKAAEVVVSDQYHIGYTMRFPRALSIREDLTLADCMTAGAVFEALRTERKRKISDTSIATKKKRKVVSKKITVLPEYQGANLKEVPIEGYLFDGMQFMVSSDPKSRTGDKDKKDLMKLIHANGGKCVQIAREQPNLFVVYGGTSTPYDLKLLINKGIYDVIKPEWIRDSVRQGHLVGLHKRYFFHATPKRVESAAYNEGDDVIKQDEDADGEHPAGPSNQAQDSETEEDDEEEIKQEIKEEPLDPLMAEWLTVKDERTTPLPTNFNDSETESDNDSDKGDVVDGGLEPEDDWVDLGANDSGALELPVDGTVENDISMAKPEERPVKNEDIDVKMGEDENAMEYDQDLIFRHLCFYLDSPSNARQHGMSARSKYENAISQSLDEVSRLVTENGGKIVGLDDPKLTHIIIDKRDDSRRVELMKRTSKPRRRRLIISEYIQACLDEATLLDEDEFAP